MKAYEYSGYLSTILYKPDPDAANQVDHVTFTAEDLANWKTEDLTTSTEWKKVVAKKIQTQDGIQLEGNFSGLAAIDSFTENDPRFWVPLSTLGLTDGRLPIDTQKYPIIEVTYRCTSENAHPVWMWTYEGGSHFGNLPKSQEWHTIARNVQHFGHPAKIDNIIFRLYSGIRSKESFELKSVTFRAMTKEETEANERSITSLNEKSNHKSFDVLKDFMPLGVYMDAESSVRLADMLGISENEYWDFVMEDLVEHDANAIALAHVDQLTPDRWEAILSRCSDNGIKILARHEYPLDGTPEEQQKVIDSSIKPYADSDAIFARSFNGEPIENDFHQVLEAKEAIEAADPNHPMSIIARYPNSYALFAPYFAASGVGHFATHRPWDAGKMVRTHVPMSDAQQFWVAAATFVYPTQTPAWSACPEMRLTSNLAFANGARGLFAYSYHNDPVWLRGRVQRTLTGPFLTFSDLWMELMQRMRVYNALAPLFLEASNEDSMDSWFTEGISTDSIILPAPGIAPISQFHLRGDDFSLYITVSNNTREMASVNINIPSDAASGNTMIDLSEYITSQNWQEMERKRHLEMFPGQAHIMLVASPDRCEYWRDVITQRIVASDLQKLKYYFSLAHTYDLDYKDIEKDLQHIVSDPTPEDFEVVHSSKAKLTDLIYTASGIVEPRNNIIMTSSAICGCDGALCRLMELGKKERAVELGTQVIPLAAELARYRLALRQGEGNSLADSSAQLTQKSLELLAQIRSEYPN
jgi:hypothetical protein